MEQVKSNGLSSALVTTEEGIVYNIDLARCVPEYYVAYAEDDDDNAIVIDAEEFSDETRQALDKLIEDYELNAGSYGKN